MDSLKIIEIEKAESKMEISRIVLEDLPEWFGIPESRDEYINESSTQVFYVAMDADRPVGFLALKQIGKDTVELAVIGVVKKYHRKGIGKELFIIAKARASQDGFSFIQVKTVKMGVNVDYDKTNSFYQSLGFKEFEVFPSLWMSGTHAKYML